MLIIVKLMNLCYYQHITRAQLVKYGRIGAKIGPNLCATPLMTCDC